MNIRKAWAEIRRIRNTMLGRRIRPLYEFANALSGYRLSDGNPRCTHIKYARTANELIERVQQLAECGRREHAESQQALNYVSHLVHQHDRDTARRLIDLALQGLPCGAASAGLVENADRFSVELPASFRVNIAVRSRKKHFHWPSDWALSGKEAAYAFVDRLQVPYPRTLASHVRLAEIEPTTPMVIKPVRGSDSKGVYLFLEAGRIFDVHNSQTLTSWSKVEDQIRRDLRSGLLRADEWLTEELILKADGTPASDLKCMSFYGHTALVLEVSRYPAIAKRWLTRDGENIEPGITRAMITGEAEGLAEAVALADRISAEIPAPFMRIDLLAGGDSLRFGEFTPRPGWFHMFNDDVDQWLGDLFLEAEERLMQDLLAGKAFSAFKAHQEMSGTRRRTAARANSLFTSLKIEKANHH